MSKRTYLPKTWVDPRLIMKTSPIEGRGVFADATIKKGETLIIWGGVVVPRKGFDETKYRILSVVPIDERNYLAIPATVKGKFVDEYMNHSCDPNVWLNDEVTVTAMRDIKKGEEITMDAALWDDDASWEYTEGGTCLCGSNICRKTLTAHDWLLPELQKRYAGHFSPHIQRKIDEYAKQNH